MTPLANAYVAQENACRMEPFYPLRAYVCEQCYLVQIPQTANPEELFTDYSYFSSYSQTWLDHAQTYVEQMIERFGLDDRSQVVEVASNDGYLLRHFLHRGVRVLGIEPARNVAAAAEALGIPTLVAFFGAETARQLASGGNRADLLVGNNVLAHVPDLNDFVQGLKIALKPQGVVTMEFPHLMRLMAGNQFDTIYHEHFCYFSLTTVEKVFAARSLVIFDVDELSTHGGSLRIYARLSEADRPIVSDRVESLRQTERDAGLADIQTYTCFSEQVKETKRKLIELLIRLKRDGKSIAAYGAPAKGNTLLNYCGIGTDFIDYTVDRSPHKQGRFLPGTRLPIFDPERIARTRPDYLLILPWNLKDEITVQMAHIRSWGGQFIVPIPVPVIC